MTIYGFLRVSTELQDVEKNKAEIKDLVESRKLGDSSTIVWVEEKVTGKKDWNKRKIGELIGTAENNDIIVTNEVSRLGRNMRDLLNLSHEAKQKQISIYIVKGNYQIDDSMASKVILTVLALGAELEADLISARTKEALAYKKSIGVKLGAPVGTKRSALDVYESKILKMKLKDLSDKQIAKKLKEEGINCSHGGIYFWLKQRGYTDRKAILNKCKELNLTT